MVRSGIGVDQIDLSGVIRSRDVITFVSFSTDFDVDTMYGFEQRPSGDTPDFDVILEIISEVCPLVKFGSAQLANIESGILRVTGAKLSKSSNLKLSFEENGGLGSFSLYATIISQPGQATVEDQFIFSVESRLGEFSIDQLAIIKGHVIDIDVWHAYNFTTI